jgi:hypothetical protein
MGRLTGKLTWSGQLPPGGRLVVNAAGLVDGPAGDLNIEPLPGFAAVDITDFSPKDQIAVSATGANVVISNRGYSPVRFIEVRWRVKSGR